MKQQLEIMWQWQMTILNSKQPINKVQQVWTTTHSKSRSSQAEAEETEATLVQESADLRTSQMEQNARDVDLSIIQPQMDPACPPICLCWLLVRKEKKFLCAVTVCLYSVSHVVHPL